MLLLRVLPAAASLFAVAWLISAIPSLLPAQATSASLPSLKAGKLYGVTVSARDLAAWPHGPVRVSIGDASDVVASKQLHEFDPDFHVTIRARSNGPARIEAAASLDQFEVSVEELIEAKQYSEQRQDWQHAQEIRLNEPVYASGDERPYIPVRDGSDAMESLLVGTHWYRFRAPSTQLAFFAVETADRDVPADIDVFQQTADGSTIEPYLDGTHPYIPEATQNFPGLSSYRTRRLNAGQTYYLRVSGNHPSYRLRTATYPLPPYRNDPRQAVRTAMDFAVSLGDSWLNNIPRRGSVATRDTLPHPETQNCIACHPTQFTTRAYLTAVRHGYKPVNREAALSLLNQLRNNPRPLPGHDGVNWSRMIFSARTVSSRVPVLLDAGATLLPGARPVPRDLVQGAAGFLKLHYKGLSELAPEEADGASPAVSPFEIALQSWQTFGLAGVERSFLESQIVDAKPETTIDINWKIIALATIHRTKYTQQIDALVADLLKKQGADLRFDNADFVTYHALYALAMAGLKPESDPRVAALVDFTLKNQLPSGGWQGTPGPKAFDTPFRETQFAIMALSTLYPESVAQPVDKRETEPAQSLIARLGHPSKITRIDAAANLRQMDFDSAMLVRALQSRDSRTRSGALHVFGKQFRDLASKPELLQAVLQVLPNEPAPLIRLQAAAALGRWYTWNPSPQIIDALSAQLQRETNARVRRVLTEALSGTLDENIGYAETWMRTMSDPADRTRTVAAMHARSRDQASILARHLRSGTRDGKLSVLSALWDLPLRHMAIPAENRNRTEVVLPAYYANYSAGVHNGFADYEPYQDALSFRYSASNGFHKTRVGNDSDLPDLSGAGPELEQALIEIIRGSDSDLRVAAIKAGSALGSSASRRFTTAILEILRSSDTRAREAARYVYENNQRGRLTLGDPDQHDAAFIAELGLSLDPAHPDAVAVAMPLLAEVPAGSLLSRNPDLMAKVEKLLFAKQVHPKALAMASSFPRVADGPLMRSVMLEALTTRDRPLRNAAVETVVKAYLADPTMPALAEQFASAAKGEVRRMMLDLLDPSRFSLRLSALSLYNPGPGVVIPPDASLFSGAQVQQFVAASLADPEPEIRAAAQDLVRLYPAQLQRSEPVRRALAANPAPRQRALDFDFFVAKVQPILAKPGADGKACVVCHVTHGLFPLRLPRANQAFTERHSKENFEFASRMIDPQNPAKSLILVKPTRPNDSAGDPNLYLATHNGGERWPDNESSEEYQTILRWIRGARVNR